MWEGGSTSHFMREDGSISRKFPSIVVTLLDRFLAIFKKKLFTCPKPTLFNNYEKFWTFLT